jgi:CDP-ribitol ribitolphosphotransferase
MLSLRIWLLRAASAVFSLLPLRRKIVLASSHASRLDGNLKAIRDEIERRGIDAETVVLLRPESRGLLGKARMALFGIVAEYHIATARVLVIDDYFFPLYVARKKPGTFVLQTWHASGAFKKVGYSVVGKSFGASEELVSRVRIHSNYDACLIGSTTAVAAYSEAFGQPADKFVTDTGIPRTDLFFDERRIAEAIARVRERYDVPAHRKVVLYAPTFRGDSRSVAAYDDFLDLREMASLLADDHIVMLRLHPWVAARAHVPADLATFVRDASDYPEFNELLLAADVLITDYSSAIFEYSLLERPMGFLAPDHDAYQAERGFYFDYLSGVPGPVFETTTQLAQWLAAGEFDLERVREFRRTSFDVADGHASNRVVERLIEPHLG